jgi:hypothetical protein
MSFVRIKTFLPGAFARIDRKNNLKTTQESSNIKHSVQESLSLTDSDALEVNFRDGVLTLFTNSQILKHKLFTQQTSLIKELQKKHPNLQISKIVFKAPKA